MMAPDHSITMERQAFPSILLSLMIVCFFAVALYPREGQPRKPGRVPSLDGTRPVAGGPARPPDPARGVAAESPPAGDPGRMAHRTTEAPSSDETRRGTPPPIVRTPAIRMVSNESEQGHPQRSPSSFAPGSGSRRSPEGRTSPSFTVVARGETIADVARRIYGTTDDVSVLWRANRDILREPDARLVPGTVLHTPEAPLR